MEQVQVKLYDDRSYHADGSLVEADASHVLVLDGRRVKLDLTDDNHQELARVLEPWLEAGSVIAPAEKYSLPAKRRKGISLNRENVTFNRTMRLWAAWQGRSAETTTSNGSGQMYYAASLRRDVTAWLTAQQMTPGQFIAAVEAGEYQPKDAGPE